MRCFVTSHKCIPLDLFSSSFLLSIIDRSLVVASFVGDTKLQQCLRKVVILLNACLLRYISSEMF